jgi:hypothetical protein
MHIPIWITKKPNCILMILLGAILALTLLLAVSHNLLIKAALGPAVRRMSGFDASLREIDVGLFSSRIELKDLRVVNPPDFIEPLMLEAPEIHAEYNLVSMMSRRREFPEVGIRIAQVVVVKNARGESNLGRLLSGKNGAGPEHGQASRNHFGKFDLRLARVILIDFTKMNYGQPQRREITLNFHGTYHDLLDTELKRVILLETLRALPTRLADATPEMVQNGLSAVIGTGLDATTNVVGEITGAVKGIDGLFHSKSNAAARTK